MSWMNLTVEDDRSWFEPGSTIAGRCSWSFDEENEGVSLRLFWYTEGRGTQDVGVVTEERIEAPSRSGSRDFRFRVPPGPYSFSGKLITLRWAIEMVADGSGLTERANLIVGPRPVELSLGEVDD